MTMEAAPSRRLPRAALVVIVAILTLGIGATVTSGNPLEGPLPPAGGGIEFSLAPDQSGTWAMPPPSNPTDRDIVLRSIEPIDPEGLTILGMAMAHPGVAATGAVAFPPAGVETRPVEGSVISPRGGATPHLDVLIGVQLAEGSESGSIRGLRVVYVVGIRQYEVLLAYSLRITRADR
jgi:hypothetical protein